MKSVARFYSYFTLPWQLFLLALCFILLFTRLGFWQLARADEKIHMLKAYRAFEGQTPTVWRTKDKQPSQYQPITLEGRYLPQVLLLDNQHVDHQFGYDVISPYLMSNGMIVLVDRGWVQGDATRITLPAVEALSHLGTITGRAYYPSTKSWILGPILEKEQGSLAVIELIDTVFLSQFLHKAVYPFIIRLGKEEGYGFVREWPTIALSPERHYAYALQWFAFAGVVLILVFVSPLKRVYDNRST